MNILHMKYAVEVARAGSINKAAESLLIAQPNLSRSIKELEADLGITIFERSPKGMTVTPEGEEFISYASKILKQIQEIEQLYKEKTVQKQRFSISLPRATYIAEAFARFSRNITSDPAEIFYMETNSFQTIKNVTSGDYKLGIVRYAANFDKYFKELFEEKGIHSELVAEFHYMLVMSRNSPLVRLSEVHYEDLSRYIEIAHADPYVPSMPLAEVKRTELPDNISRRIFVFERGGQFDLLAENPETFMWVSPLTEKMLKRYDLVQKVCPDNQKLYKDMLIFRNDHMLSELDKKFITELCIAKRKYL
ncbi:MAG TPA: LysR family transcriptional regulator [Ruminococcus sp.]|nr:LysR family transcriptional regulator [Ruminococcus sp.]